MAGLNPGDVFSHIKTERETWRGARKMHELSGKKLKKSSHHSKLLAWIKLSVPCSRASPNTLRNKSRCGWKFISPHGQKTNKQNKTKHQGCRQQPLTRPCVEIVLSNKTKMMFCVVSPVLFTWVHSPPPADGWRFDLHHPQFHKSRAANGSSAAGRRRPVWIYIYITLYIYVYLYIYAYIYIYTYIYWTRPSCPRSKHRVTLINKQSAVNWNLIFTIFTALFYPPQMYWLTWKLCHSLYWAP